MKKFFAILLVVAIAVSFVFAGGSGESSEAPKSDKVKIALIIENTIDDKGWCQAMYDGLVEADTLIPGEFEFKVAEKQAVVDAGSIARQFVADGYDLIIAHGAQYKSFVLELAEDYPNVSFAYGTSGDVGPKNVFTYMPESEETGYLSGIIAGMLTKSNIVGYVGPIDGGDAARYGRGFIMGVKDVNPDAKVMVAHSGSFSDYVKAGEVANTLMGNGADMLTGASQQAIGALRSVADNPTALWIGQDIAQIGTTEGQKKCLAASSYNYGAVIVELVHKIKSGTLGGEVIPMNFNNGGFIFEFNDALSSLVPAEVVAKVNEAIDAFKAEAGTKHNYVEISY